MRIYVLLMAVLLVSCSPQYRFNRLIKNHPELKKSEIIYVKDTVVIKTTQLDTLLKYDTIIKGDTVRLIKDNLIIKVKYKDRNIYISGKCKGDTIYIDRKVELNKYNNTDKLALLRSYSILIFGICLLLLILFLIFKK